MLLFMQLADLEVRHLIALDAVASAGTFGRAAERLGYTQSAVSQQIAALERIVGARLFDRPGGPRPVELTPLGRQVLASARDLLARVDAIGEDLVRFQNGEAGRNGGKREAAKALKHFKQSCGRKKSQKTVLPT